MEMTPSTTPRVTVGKVQRWGSMMGGGALALIGLSHRSLGGMAIALLGGGLIYRGLAGDGGRVREALGIETPADQAPALSIPHERGIKISRSVTINRPPEEVYAFWRNLENLPLFMDHLEAVHEAEPLRSHWVAKAPAGMKVEWDAEIINDIPNELIGWRSLENADVPNAGSVHFEPSPRGRGTRLNVIMKYDPPVGPVGDAFAKLFGQSPSQTIRADLGRLKGLFELDDARPRHRSRKGML